MSDIENELRAKIVTIIDDNEPYRIVRRPYDEDFAKEHGMALEHIMSKIFVPCLMCGCDIAPMILMSKFKVRENVYCSAKCRAAAGFYRMTKINDKTDINQMAKELVARCLDLEMSAPIKRQRAGARLETAALLLQTNALLRDILKELKYANRPAGTAVPLSKDQ